MPGDSGTLTEQYLTRMDDLTAAMESGDNLRIDELIAELTTIRWSHVEMREPPWKSPMARKAERKASWTASRASSSERRKRLATDSMRPL